jgi:FixJ family two-component response regulator
MVGIVDHDELTRNGATGVSQSGGIAHNVFASAEYLLFSEKQRKTFA